MASTSPKLAFIASQRDWVMYFLVSVKDKVTRLSQYTGDLNPLVQVKGFDTFNLTASQANRDCAIFALVSFTFMTVQNYKIFVNNVQIIITQKKPESNSNKIKEVKQVDELINLIFSGIPSSIKTVYFISNDIKNDFKKFKSKFKIIKAAGGVVLNENHQLLLIKRLGKWDLPKGKIEKGEDTRLAALREVHEECGINFIGIRNKNCTTYHMYILKGQWVIKVTHWFDMIAWGDSPLDPQLEEDITEVRWVDKSFIEAEDFNTYDTLKDIFKELKFK